MVFSLFGSAMAVNEDNLKNVGELLKPLNITVDDMLYVREKMTEMVERGLQEGPEGSSSVKCYPTFVTGLPTGRESCRCLAVDLGGTNLRCLLVTMSPYTSPSIKEEHTSVPLQVMKGPGHELFDFVAVFVKNFLKENGLMDAMLPLGFTFSFPCKQEGLAVARLQNWTKGYDCTGVVGEDVGALLNAALANREVLTPVVAVLNDTTGCLMSCAGEHPTARIGVILGTGTNACYVERADNVRSIPDRPGGLMLINTEWGAFGDNGELAHLLTDWDRQLDLSTINPGRQTLEKLMSGLYLGEVVRLVLVDLYNRGHVAGRLQMESPLLMPGSLPTSILASVESDPAGTYVEAQAAWELLGYPEATVEDCFILRLVCESVSNRCSSLLAGCLSSLLDRIPDSEVTIGVDGGLFKHHPLVRERTQLALKLLVGRTKQFQLTLAEDGSGRGAAVVAATLADNVHHTQYVDLLNRMTNDETGL